VSVQLNWSVLKNSCAKKDKSYLGVTLDLNN